MNEDGFIGAKLRSLRRARGMTLKELAALTESSIGHLSQLERDMASPSVRMLYVISRALGVTISGFFDNGEALLEENPYVLRRVQRRHIGFLEGIDDYRLTSETVTKLGLLYSTFKPRASITEFYSHEGEEAGYVVTGQFEIEISNFKATLTAGDSFSFPSRVPHRYRNPGDIETAVVWAMTPPTY